MAMISSLTNPKIKELIKLKKAQERRRTGSFIIDGAREISLAIEAGQKIQEIFYCPSIVKNKKVVFEKLISGLGVEVSEKVFNKICYKDKPDGFLALAEIKDFSFKDLKLNKNPLIIVLEAVEKPGNIGAIIRTAYAAGIDAIIINDNQTDLYNPNIIRASEGLIFKEKIIIATFRETIGWLKKNKIKSLAATTTGIKKYSQADFKKATAVILGSEANGLSEKWLQVVDQQIKIPMQVGMDSLNVSVSAAIIIFEALRQRGF